MRIIGNNYVYLKIDEHTLTSNFVNCILVIDNFELGTLESPTYIPSFMASLNSLLLEKIYFIEHMNIQKFTNMIDNGVLENSYMFTLEETFDDFMKRCVRDRENLYFYFKLYEEPNFSYQDMKINFPVIKVISIDKFKHFLETSKNYFNGINFHQKWSK